MTHLLDTSAWLAHLFGESGADRVTELFADTRNEVIVCCLSIPEVYARLKSMGGEGHWPEVWSTYSALFSKVVPINEAIAHRAVAVRAAAPDRLPTVDALIAATAGFHDAVLVHLDPHFDAVPSQCLKQLRLPGRES